MCLENNSLGMVILLGCGVVTLASRSYVIDFESFHREWNASLYDPFTVDMILDGKRQLFNGSITNAIPLDQFQLNLGISIVRKNGQQRKVVDMTVDGCKFLSNVLGGSNQIAGVAMKFIRSIGRNIPTSCPIKKGWEILVDNVYIDSEKFPPYLPEVVFETQLSMKYKNTFGYKIKLLGSVMSKNKKTLLT